MTRSNYDTNKPIEYLDIKRDQNVQEYADGIWETIEVIGDDISEQLSDLREYITSLGDDEDAPPSLERIAHLCENISSYCTAFGQATVYAKAQRALPEAIAFDVMRAMSKDEKWRPSVVGMVIGFLLYGLSFAFGLAVYHFLIN